MANINKRKRKDQHKNNEHILNSLVNQKKNLWQVVVIYVSTNNSNFRYFLEQRCYNLLVYVSAPQMYAFVGSRVC